MGFENFDNSSTEPKVEGVIESVGENVPELVREQRDNITKSMIEAATDAPSLILILKALGASMEGGDPKIYDHEFAMERYIDTNALEIALTQAQRLIDAGDPESAKHELLEYFMHEEPGKEIGKKLSQLYPDLNLLK